MGRSASFGPNKESDHLSIVRKSLAAAALISSALVGGAIGTAIFSGAFANAQTTTTPTRTTPDPTNAAPNGSFHPNEDPTHESHESAQREAQENAGQMPTVP